jgi:hypothetical protein
MSKASPSLIRGPYSFSGAVRVEEQQKKGSIFCRHDTKTSSFPSEDLGRELARDKNALTLTVLGLLLFLVMRSPYPLPLLAFLGVIMTLLLRGILLGVLVLGVVRVLALLGWLVLVPVLVVLPTLLILGFAHRGIPSI